MTLTTLVTLAVLLAAVLMLYSRRVQGSTEYQATVVPLANMMDIGFVAMSPIIILLTGVDAVLTMLGLCALGYAMGWVMRYNIAEYEPVADQPGFLNHAARVAKWALVVASLVNVAYYVQLMGGAILYPFAPDGNDALLEVIAIGSLLAVGLFGFVWGLDRLDTLGQRTTAFNLAAILAVIAGFAAFNIEAAMEGQWALTDYDPPFTERATRQIIGLFAIVQGFEASRYMGERYPARQRIRTMRRAQLVATVAFVLFPAVALLAFARVQPSADGSAVLQVADVASPVLPWMLLLLAVGSQASASINAISSRSDVLVEVSGRRLPRRYTFPLLAAGAILVVLATDVLAAVSVASRVFAIFFAIQCLIAVAVARRRGQWRNVVGLGAVGLAMVGIAVFGLSA